MDNVYYVVKITTKKEDGTKTKAIYEFETLKEGQASYYKTYGSCLSDSTLKHCMCMLIDKNGMTHLSAHWEDVEEVKAVIINETDK